MNVNGELDRESLKELLEEIINDQNNISEKYNDLLRESKTSQEKTAQILTNQANLAKQVEKLIGFEDGSLSNKVQMNNNTIDRIHYRIDSLSKTIIFLEKILFSGIGLILLTVLGTVMSLVLKSSTVEDIPPRLPGKGAILE